MNWLWLVSVVNPNNGHRQSTSFLAEKSAVSFAEDLRALNPDSDSIITLYKLHGEF